ncbi:MAG: hypothetical protein ACK5V3_16720 [Bdellovibrionales bacterium]
MSFTQSITFIVVFSSLNLGVLGYAQNPPAPAPSCSPQEISRLQLEVERATLDKVRQDIRAEGRVQASALGVDDRDCLERARRSVMDQQGRALEQCVRQTVYFKSCEVADVRISRAPSRIEAVHGHYKIDEYKTDEVNCKVNAQNSAVQTALNGCRNAYGRSCRIVAGPTPATHSIERRRRYGIAGPKENFHVCVSSASALPDSREQIQCSMELVAKVRIL